MADATYALAEKLIGEQRSLERQQETRALSLPSVAEAHKAGYGLAVRDLEGAAVNLRAFSRGMIAPETLPHYIAEARDALVRIEQALVVQS